MAGGIAVAGAGATCKLQDPERLQGQEERLGDLPETGGGGGGVPYRPTLILDRLQVRRSQRELKGEEPRYLVRTGSLRTRKILDSPAPSSRSEGGRREGGRTDGGETSREEREGGSREGGDTLRKNDGETCYMLQTGCYVWTGR